MTLSSCRGVECDALIDDPVTLNVPQDKEVTGFSRARQAIRAIRGGPVSACGTKEFSTADGDFGRVRPRLRGGSMCIAAAGLSQQLHEQPIDRGLLMAALRGASS